MKAVIFVASLALLVAVSAEPQFQWAQNMMQQLGVSGMRDQAAAVLAQLQGAQSQLQQAADQLQQARDEVKGRSEGMCNMVAKMQPYEKTLKTISGVIPQMAMISTGIAQAERACNIAGHGKPVDPNIKVVSRDGTDFRCDCSQ